ncbi:amidophosphoribosyltransferase [Dysgonomonas sp. Marseille-P4677]|uniref:amidophosphoribosyltransferase n=1 Tax=Dysgonomonas sp. Marseille-P4677 TaxID=2364790 RepID=UPI00191441AF|nr:amidophosphoribosyltransferase [Dysgonomonas sp. Marseille-P4677]MBK5720390.1 amidophosphoribosyltransferase [Dysgonomonas sp. Marseille-P4677]
MGGFFGTISKSPCATDLFYGTDYNSHLGTRRGGMATLHEGKFMRSIHNLENSYFRLRFEADLDKFKGNSGIGIISDTDPQPIFISSHLGKYAVVTVAKVNNLEELENELLAKGCHFSELNSGQTNQTELIALLISQADTFLEGIELVYQKIKGSCSMLILTEKGIIVARDKWGRTPVLVGKKYGAYAVSSEPCSFPNLDFEVEYNVGPGEVLLLEADRMTQLRKPNKKMQVCSFLWVYYGYPVSDYEGVNVDAARYASGLTMAKKDDTIADYVAGIPDSGIGMGLGYAEGKGIPYRRAIIKYTPTWPRSFTPANQNIRDLVAKMKLIPNRNLLKDKRVIFCDDSIVRGTQLNDNVNILYGYGAKEVHMRIGSPPIIHTCPYLGFTASKSAMELITRRTIKELEGDDSKDLDKYATTDSEQYTNMVNSIREKLNITTLRFNTVEDLVSSIGLPKECVCTHCYNGQDIED